MLVNNNKVTIITFWIKGAVIFSLIANTCFCWGCILFMWKTNMFFFKLNYHSMSYNYPLSCFLTLCLSDFRLNHLFLNVKHFVCIRCILSFFIKCVGFCFGKVHWPDNWKHPTWSKLGDSFTYLLCKKMTMMDGWGFNYFLSCMSFGRQLK